MIKEFFKKNSHLKFTLGRSSQLGGCWVVEIFNQTYDRTTPCFRHIYPDFECDNLNVDFDTFIMTPIISWSKEQDEKYKQFLENIRKNR